MRKWVNTLWGVLIALCVILACCVPAHAQIATRKLTNNSGVTLDPYDVVIVDTSADNSVTTTTSERAALFGGIVATTTLNGQVGTLVVYGIYDVTCNGTVTRGDWLITSTTAGEAKSGGTADNNNAFGIALEGGTDTQIATFIVGPVPQPTGALMAGDTFIGDVTATLESDGDTPLTIAADSVALSTDTTGQFVYSVSATATAGVLIGEDAPVGDGKTYSIVLDTTRSLSGDHAFSANNGMFGSNGLIFEGSAADTIEAYIAIANPTSTDKTFTFPDRTGTVALSGDTLIGDVTATLNASGTTTTAIGTGVIVNADVHSSAAIVRSKLVVKTPIWLSAASAKPTTTGGATAPALDANDHWVCEFAASTYAFWEIPAPSDYDDGVETINVYWYKGDTNAVTWTLANNVFGQGTATNQAYSGGGNTGSQTPSGANTVQIDPITDTDILGSSSAGKLIKIRIGTDAFSGTSAYLLGIEMEY